MDTTKFKKKLVVAGAALVLTAIGGVAAHQVKEPQAAVSQTPKTNLNDSGPLACKPKDSSNKNTVANRNQMDDCLFVGCSNFF